MPNPRSIRSRFKQAAITTGALVPFKGRWFLYDGAADPCTGVATCPIRE